MAKLLFGLTRGEFGTILAFLAVILILIWTYGCESKVPSIKDSDREVTRGELCIELDYLIATAEYRFADLDKQDEIKQVLFQNAMIAAQGGQINPLGVMSTLFGVLGIGATVDNIRKRKELKALKKPTI